MQRLAADSASIGQSIHRFEVITGDPARRSHEDAFKVELVLHSLEPGVCIADVARANGIHPQLLYTWRREAKLGKLALPARTGPDFAPLVIAEDCPAPATDSAPPEIGIEQDGVTIRVAGDTSAVRIAEIAAALRDAR